MTGAIKIKKNIFDLEERTALFGENIIKFCREIDRNDITRPLIHQMIKCGTSELNLIFNSIYKNTKV